MPSRGRVLEPTIRSHVVGVGATDQGEATVLEVFDRFDELAQVGGHRRMTLAATFRGIVLAFPRLAVHDAR